MAADCVVIGADHPNSAGDEVIGGAGFFAAPSATAVAAVLEYALNGE